ncbi:MAG: hypothetical protein KC900_08625 [Candidatus Omnitrophica bacterium]|nr:hypothetical protein [Candidatus Omnitrophota bacterium]
MKGKVLGFVIVLAVGAVPPAHALNDYPVYLQKYKRAYDSLSVREDHKIRFGYHPYYFSNDARSRYSYSAFEKGHYRYAHPDKPWPFPVKAFRLQPDHGDPTRVLTSGNPAKQQQKLHAYIQKRMREAKQRPAEPQVNDSRQLDDLIRRHKWEYQSPAMREAVQRDGNDVRVDPTDYLELFQEN